MKKIIKKSGEAIRAYKLGESDPMIETLIKEGKIKWKEDGTWEIFSQEAVDGRGEIACSGDYIKVDHAGCPYPNSAEYFEKHHRYIGGNDYEQITNAMDAWDAEEEMCPEIEFLIRHKDLSIHEETPERYFEAPLWGSILSAARDAILIFYDIRKDETGQIKDIDFNFISRSEFEKTYDIIE